MLKINFNFRGLLKSIGKVLQLLALMLLPLMINMAIVTIPANDKIAALSSKIVPGEMLAYCLSLIAPLFLFVLKSHGYNFKLPWLGFIFLCSLAMYLTSLVLSVVAKNNYVKGIDLNGGHKDFYFWISLILLFSAILLRIYTDFQEGRFSDFKQTIDKEQQDFNKSFRSSLP